MLRHGCFALAAVGAQVAANAAQNVALEDPSIYLKPSSNPRRKASFYIPRMRDTEPAPFAIKVDKELGTALPLFKITSTSCEYYALRLPLLKAGFKRLLDPTAPVPSNMVWGRSMPLREQRVFTEGPLASPALVLAPSQSEEQRSYLQSLALSYPCQYFNHFPLSHRNLGCKMGMERNLRQYDNSGFRRVTPRTFIFPQEARDLVAALEAAPSSKHFIWKPARGSCGRGIFLTEGGSSPTASWRRVMREVEARRTSEDEGTSRAYRHYVVQEYLEEPLLLDGRKMDLRLYVVVSSYDPLTVYWHEEGLVRLAAEEYDDEDNDAGDTVSQHARFKHLTNYSVGRKYSTAAAVVAGPGADAAAATACGEGSGAVAGPELKWSLQKLWDYLDSNAEALARDSTHVAEMLQASRMAAGTRSLSGQVKESIAQQVVQSLMTVKPTISQAVRRTAVSGSFFEIYGFDIMLDRHLEPHLIEVNTLPSLESSSTLDYGIKTNVVSDCLNLMMIEAFERDPASLLALGPETKDLRPPSAAIQPLVHSISEINAASTTPRAIPSSVTADVREDIVTRLQDELSYARGLKRIFPPVLNSHPHAATTAFPITAASQAMKRDIEMFASMGLLSPFDEVAIEYGC